jgi:transcriptional regulator with XRE-family HTH domain
MRLLDDHKEWLKNPKYKAAYDGLAQEFAIASALIRARAEAGLTQEEVAKKLGVTQPAVARMESGKNISLKTITRYANAVQQPIRLEILPA